MDLFCGIAYAPSTHRKLAFNLDGQDLGSNVPLLKDACASRRLCLCYPKECTSLSLYRFSPVVGVVERFFN